MSEALTTDQLLAGRLNLTQPSRGHRAGTDAMLLVAAAKAEAGSAAGTAAMVVDLGAGVGTVGLALVTLGRARRALLVERDPLLADLARRNAAANGVSTSTVVVEADIMAPAGMLAAAGLEAGVADVVVCNPPYNTPGRHRASPDAGRALAHAMTKENMAQWLKCAARCLTGGGRLALIHRPEALPWLLPLVAARFGGLSILPVQPAADQPAGRVLIGARLNTKAPARVLPALVLHGSDGAFTSEVAGFHAGEGHLRLWS